MWTAWYSMVTTAIEKKITTHEKCHSRYLTDQSDNVNKYANVNIFRFDCGFIISMVILFCGIPRSFSEKSGELVCVCTRRS